MTPAALPVAEDDGPLSHWWLRTILIVMLLGFAGLGLVSLLSYRNAPPDLRGCQLSKSTLNAPP